MSYDNLDSEKYREPRAMVAGHKVYRKEACTMNHRPIPARSYLGLKQCACCFGIIAPELRRLLRVAA